MLLDEYTMFITSEQFINWSMNGVYGSDYDVTQKPEWVVSETNALLLQILKL